MKKHSKAALLTLFVGLAGCYAVTSGSIEQSKKLQLCENPLSKIDLGESSLRRRKESGLKSCNNIIAFERLRPNTLGRDPQFGYLLWEQADCRLSIGAAFLPSECAQEDSKKCVERRAEAKSILSEFTKVLKEKSPSIFSGEFGDDRINSKFTTRLKDACARN